MYALRMINKRLDKRCLQLRPCWNDPSDRKTTLKTEIIINTMYNFSLQKIGNSIYLLDGVEPELTTLNCDDVITSIKFIPHCQRPDDSVIFSIALTSPPICFEEWPKHFEFDLSRQQNIRILQIKQQESQWKGRLEIEYYKPSKVQRQLFDSDFRYYWLEDDSLIRRCRSEYYNYENITSLMLDSKHRELFPHCFGVVRYIAIGYDGNRARGYHLICCLNYRSDS